jgi:transcriptional regulator EpsA
MLLVNIEAAVKVERRPDFFLWVQGVFQGMIPHEGLICGVPDPAAPRLRFEWIGSYPIGEDRLAELSRLDGGPLHILAEAWRAGGCNVLLLRMAAASDKGLAAVQEDLRQIMGLGDVVAHGLTGLGRSPAAFFAFLKPSPASPRDARMLALLLPYLYAAWWRSTCDEVAPVKPVFAACPEVLTARQIEVLSWVEKGKSNNEIAQILAISHPTVKNHVQKIFRKLNVQNRAQAVAKGMSLQLTSR